MVRHPLIKIHHLLFAIITIIAINLTSSLSFADAEKIFKENNGAVVVVKAHDYEGKTVFQGSGFVVSQDGAIVTNYHVINKAASIWVKVGIKSLLVEGFLHIDKENDLVILKAKIDTLGAFIAEYFRGEKKELPVVRMGDVDKLNIGEKVYVISSPEGFANTITEGILSGIRHIGSERKILQITAPISRGSSGGPLFNKSGEVIGVVTFFMEGAQNLNFAIPIDLIKDKINNKEIISLESIQQEFERDYIRSLATELASTQDWSRTKIPTGKEIEVYNQVLRLNPYHINAHVHLFLAHYSTGDKMKALEHYRILKQLDPRKAEALRYLYGL